MKDGVPDGTKVGRKDGVSEGDNEGITDGLHEGNFEGRADGARDGKVVGAKEGIDGDSLGEIVEGLGVGDEVGLWKHWTRPNSISSPVGFGPLP